MKMYLLTKQMVKENYRYFSTMFAGVLFLVMIFYFSFSNSGQNSFVHFVAVCFMLAYALTVPMILFAYLYHPINVHHVASIPMTRYEIFFNGYLFGLAFGLLMILGYTSLTTLLSGTQGDWIFHTTYLMLSFIYYYHLSVFCYWICGNKLFYGLMALFCIIGPVLFYFVFEWVMQNFVLGYQSSGFETSIFKLFFPLYNTFTCIITHTIDHLSLFYLALTAIFLVLSIVAMHYRHTEKTGQSISFAILGYFIRFAIAFLGSSFLLCIIIDAHHSKGVMFAAYLIICLMVTYCIEMVFSKKTNVLYSLKYGILLCISGFILLNGVSHYLEDYIPEFIEEASISSRNEATDTKYYSLDQETIERVKTLHQQLLENKTHIYDSYYGFEDGYYPVQISYKTSTGSYSNRLYYCDDYLYQTVLLPALENRGIYDLSMGFEYALIDWMDEKDTFIIEIDDEEYRLDTMEKHYLFKNYLKQQIEALSSNSQWVLEEKENSQTTYMRIFQQENIDFNQVMIFLSSTYSLPIERAIENTFK